MKHIALFLLLLLFMAPAYAQEEGTPVAASSVVAAQPDVSRERLALAGKMHEVWPIRTRMESALDAIADGFPADRRAEILSALRKSIKYDQLEEASIKAMATTFTEDELKAMIDFYGSDVGRSISAKTGDYEAAIQPVLSSMMDKALLEMKVGPPPQ